VVTYNPLTCTHILPWSQSPSPPGDSIRATMIVRRIRGKIMTTATYLLIVYGTARVDTFTNSSYSELLV